MKTKKEHTRGGCGCCPRTGDILGIDTVLYNGFGGYHVEKDGQTYYQGDPNGEWERFKTLAQIEEEAKKDPHVLWKVILNNPLRGAVWGRKENGEWILLETNQGFA